MSSCISPDRISFFLPPVDFFQSCKILIIFPDTFFCPEIFHRILDVGQYRIYNKHDQITDDDIDSNLDQINLIHIIHKIFAEICGNACKSQYISDRYQKKVSDQCKSNIITSIISAHRKILPAFAMFIHSQTVHNLHFFFIYHKNNSS